MVQMVQDTAFGDNHEGYITSSSFSQLKVLNHVWVKVSKKESDISGSRCSLKKVFEEFENTKNDVIVRLNLHPKSYPVADEMSDKIADNVIYVSPATLFNFSKQIAEEYRHYSQNGVEVKILVLESFSPEEGLLSNEFSVSPIACPFGVISVSSVDSILKEYFEKSRVIVQNELFAVQTPSADILAPIYLWFKVKSVTPCINPSVHTNAVFVNSTYSKLMEEDAIASSVPSCCCCRRNNASKFILYRNPFFQEAFKKEMHEISQAMMLLLGAKKVESSNVNVLFEGPRGAGKGMLVRTLCEKFCLHYYEENCFDLIGESLAASEKRIDKTFQLAAHSEPCVLYLKNVHLIGKDKEGIHQERRLLHCIDENIKVIRRKCVLVIGSTYASKDITTRLFSQFVYHVSARVPTEANRLCILKMLTGCISWKEKLLEDIARKTAGFVLSDLIGLVRDLKVEGHIVNESSLSSVLESLRKLKSESSNIVNIPKVTWEDVGGLKHAKKDILDTIELPLQFPDLFASGIKRSGLLFYGPPGCGKTLLAKAIATEFTLNFYSVKGPELINMYVGQSEENVRDVFEKARSMSPCVVFFDELDSLAPNRGRSGDSGGVMDRVVSQLLAELDGMQSNTDVFIVAATNRPDLIDPALLRPGRLDKLIYVGVPDTEEDKLRVLNAVTRRLNLSGDINLKELIGLCPDNLTGADFYSLAAESQMNCYRRLIEAHKNNGDVLNPAKAIVIKEDIDLALQNISPSISVQELERYRNLQKQIDVET